MLVAAVRGAGLSPQQFFGGAGYVGPVLGEFFPVGGRDPRRAALRALDHGSDRVRGYPHRPGPGRARRRPRRPEHLALAAGRSGRTAGGPAGAGHPELILAIVFVIATGLGPVAGVLALGLGSVGFLGKLLADSLEELDPGPRTGLTATGASSWQVLIGSTLPQAVPAVIGHVLHQLDVNVRSATLLGIVGAGGIGFHLISATRVLQFDVVTTVILMVLGVVLLIEATASWLRRATA
ncbi:ABC transporter permease subunit [Streptomyces sp. M10(2022)]